MVVIKTSKAQAGIGLCRSYITSRFSHDLGHLSSLTRQCKERYLFYRYSSIRLYQSPLILTELFQHNLINVSYLTACYLYQVMMMLHFLNDVANDAEPTQA